MTDLRTLLALGRRALAYEISLYRSLLRWALRRPSVGPDEQPVGYAQMVTPVMSLWIFASAVEVPVVHLLLPWDGVRNAVLLVSVYGLLWMIGLLASLRAYPHLMSAGQLRVRHGARIDVRIPWSEVERVIASRRELPSTIRTLHRVAGEDGIDLHVAVSGETNVSVLLRRPLPLRTPGGSLEARAVSFLVDDPQRFVADARRHVDAAVPGGSPR